MATSLPRMPRSERAGPALTRPPFRHIFLPTSLTPRQTAHRLATGSSSRAPLQFVNLNDLAKFDSSITNSQLRPLYLSRVNGMTINIYVAPVWTLLCHQILSVAISSSSSGEIWLRTHQW
jgi:hypothetical protein